MPLCSQSDPLTQLFLEKFISNFLDNISEKKGKFNMITTIERETKTNKKKKHPHLNYNLQIH